MMHEPAASSSLTGDDWETALTTLLDDLLQTQQAMLEILDRKRTAMVRRDLEQIRDLQPQEELLCEQLNACQQRRNDLLALARTVNLPDDNLEQLSRSVSLVHGEQLQEKFSNASSRSILLKHQSLTNWIIAQRNLLHVSQLLENITSGGRGTPTYEKTSAGRAVARPVGGFVLDQEA